MVPTYVGPRNSFTVSGVADMGLDIESEKGRRSTFYVRNLKRNRVLKCAVGVSLDDFRDDSILILTREAGAGGSSSLRFDRFWTGPRTLPWTGDRNRVNQRPKMPPISGT
jgi:hypothetical protein